MSHAESEKVVAEEPRTAPPSADAVSWQLSPPKEPYNAVRCHACGAVFNVLPMTGCTRCFGFNFDALYDARAAAPGADPPTHENAAAVSPSLRSAKHNEEEG